MRKLILSICLFIVAIAASAQLTPTGGISYTPVTGIDYVFIFNGLDNAAINYNGSGKDVKWYKFSDQITPFFTGVNLFDNLTDGTGYIFEDAEGKKKTFWVIDYSQHKPEFTFELNNNATDQCKNVNLNITTTASELKYQTPNGASSTIPRKFKVTYNTLKWESDRWSQVPVDTTLTLNATTNTPLLLPAPFCKTTYTLSGDQYAKELGTTEKEIVSAEYTPVAVICHETSITTTRKDVLNENERPKEETDINNSGPLEIQFLANANEPITTFYKWEIFKDKKLISTGGLKEYRFTFPEAGDYYSKVTVSSTANACSFSDSIKVTVSDSQIKVPNVFTPNGDGKNDEFRIAYKSIVSFHCWVYNRWGRLVYEWTDPQKGWDGKIGGRDASPGPYYYVINAKGTDSKKYKLKGDINLLRGTGN